MFKEKLHKRRKKTNWLKNFCKGKLLKFLICKAFLQINKKKTNTSIKNRNAFNIKKRKFNKAPFSWTYGHYFLVCGLLNDRKNVLKVCW